ncbi:MAG: ATP-grasp domain-containing protein [Actinobacteria bacterium]|nr:MAG: ATP-grasp domain-containing protein [Actinomycetota bacterium]RIK07351.1 MAG: acetyl-CoA carboxylase biotin carboxylase subunit [Acidobacteriota bacterium]
MGRLLIANRGEIAVRIAATARRLGIETVGIYSEPDRNALHVDSVERAVALGGATPTESYLRSTAVLEAALHTGCEAVHPGYGFLAENAAFARSVEEAGLIWVGPTPEQMSSLGDKVVAKQTAVEAGVPTGPVITAAPGFVPDGLELPVLVKAAAGGGGRGMRIVRTTAELGDAVVAAAREAESAFGDGTVFIEPFIERGRHVEVQIMGDAHGNVIHLGERECSIQRRNQKIIEEAPSPGITEATRSALLDGALALARHVGYRSAGTVEFLVADDGTIDFLEVNTRLQVEHPVTEAVTGLDLVEIQLEVAAGEVLSVSQADVRLDGHAIEARLVAEDPAAGWVPASGLISRFEVTAEVRVDAGVRAGDLVSSDYDSLLAKVISHGASRREAIGRLHQALRRARVFGPRTNHDTLVAILEDEDFGAARTPTTYLAQHPELAAATGPEGDARLALLLGAVFNEERLNRRSDPVWGFALSGWRNLRTQGQRQRWLDLTTGREEYVEYEFKTAEQVEVLVGEWPIPGDDGSLSSDRRRRVALRLLQRDDEAMVLEVDGTRWSVAVEACEGTVHTASSAGQASWRLAPVFVDHDAELVAGGPVAPLPGTVIAIEIAVGDEVEEGQTLIVLEAMKMEHRIGAPGHAIVTDVCVVEGDRVDAGDMLVMLEAVE